MLDKDYERLRTLALKKAEYAHSSDNDEILKKWHDQSVGKRGTPTVRLLCSNFVNEMIYPYMQCVEETARKLEFDLLFSMSGRELFNDDTPVTDTFEVSLRMSASPFGTAPDITQAEGENAKGFHINPVINDLKDDFDKLLNGSFSVDFDGTKKYIDVANEIFGDILPAKMVMGSLTGALTNPLVHLMGMENYYCAMYDYSDELHKAMDMATKIYENLYDYLENNKLLLPTKDTCPLCQESFCFNSELPTDAAIKTTDCWGFLESQETTAVSPQTFGEFVFPYQDRLVKRFGLLSYGCCERVDAIFPDYLSKWKNLRKLSVSPFNNEKLVGEYLRDTNIVYYSKPRAEYLTIEGPLDENAICEYFKTIAENASGCILEVAQREAGTLFREPNRGRRYVELAKNTINKYWKP